MIPTPPRLSGVSLEGTGDGTDTRPRDACDSDAEWRVCGFIGKAKSPSCGVGNARGYYDLQYDCDMDKRKGQHEYNNECHLIDESERTDEGVTTKRTAPMHLTSKRGATGSVHPPPIRLWQRQVVGNSGHLKDIRSVTPTEYRTTDGGFAHLLKHGTLGWRRDKNSDDDAGRRDVIPEDKTTTPRSPPGHQLHRHTLSHEALVCETHLWDDMKTCLTRLRNRSVNNDSEDLIPLFDDNHFALPKWRQFISAVLKEHYWKKHRRKCFLTVDSHDLFV